MVATQQDAILKDLESYFNCHLEFDANHSCLIKLKVGISIQLEFNAYGLLIAACRLGTPQGRFLDEVFRETLRANSFLSLSGGTFGFSQKSGNIILFIVIDPRYLNSTEAARYFDPFIARAKQWADALAQNRIPVLEPEQNS